MLFLRSLLFSLLCVSTGIVFGLLSFLCWLLPKNIRTKPMLLWVKMILAALRIVCNIKLEIVNQNKGPLPQPAVILSKHQSTWETWFLQLHFWPLVTILKKQLLYIPFFGWGLALFSPITIDRTTRLKAAKQVKEQGVARLHSGKNVLVFPEGTRVPVGETRPFARSGVDLAAAAKVPIIPVTHNAGLCWPTKKFIKKPGTITVVIGEPIDPCARNSKDIINDVKAWVESGGKVLPQQSDRADLSVSVDSSS